MASLGLDGSHVLARRNLATAVRSVDRAPTAAQKAAGNYAKGHVKFLGFDLSIENPKGSVRSGVNDDGKSWRATLPAHYGYIKRTEGADGDHVDVYLGPDLTSRRIFVIDQIRPGRVFDEHKVMMGFSDKAEALGAYAKAFSDGKGKDRIGAVTEIDADQMRQWLESGNTRQPMFARHPRYASGGRVSEGARVIAAREWMAEQKNEEDRNGNTVQRRASGGRAEQLPEAPWLQYQRQNSGAVDDWAADSKVQPAPVAPSKPAATFDPDAYLRSKPQQEFPDAPWTQFPRTDGVSELPDAPWASEPKQPRIESWSDVPMAALRNAPSSAWKFGSDLVQPFLHPIDTATSLKNVALGAAEKAGIRSGTEYTPYADAVGNFFAERYGGLESLKQTMASDPIGFLADASMILTGGGSAVARAPGVVGKVGEVASAAGRTIDPLSAAGAAVRTAGKGASEVIGGLGTHTGGESLRVAARAGYEGGEAARSFQEHMRGVAPMDDVVTEARGALAQMRQERGDLYRAGMTKVGADPTVLDFTKIDAALADISSVKTYKGQVISPKTQVIRQEIGETVRDWKRLDPAEFHTVEGLDALKQKLGDIRDATQFGTRERVVADRAYHAVRRTIIDQAPEYARVMKGYEEASKQIKEIERTLSLNPGASVDTALRKLQSVLRNNVSSNYGNRRGLAEFLVEAGAPSLMQKLAGQALSATMPRSWGKLVGAEILAMGAGHVAAGPVGMATGIATLPFMSPRLMGEAAYYTGLGARHLPLRGTGRGSYQVGREEEATATLPRGARTP